MEHASGSNHIPSHQSTATSSHTSTREGRLSHKTPTRYVQKNHPTDQIIGDEDAGVETRRRKQFQSPEQGHISLLSKIEPKDFDQASRDKSWTKAMEEEISQIEKNNT